MSKVDYTKHEDRRVKSPTIEDWKFFVAGEEGPHEGGFDLRTTMRETHGALESSDA